MSIATNPESKLILAELKTHEWISITELYNAVTPKISSSRARNAYERLSTESESSEILHENNNAVLSGTGLLISQAIKELLDKDLIQHKPAESSADDAPPFWVRRNSFDAKYIDTYISNMIVTLQLDLKGLLNTISVSADSVTDKLILTIAPEESVKALKALVMTLTPSAASRFADQVEMSLFNLAPIEKLDPVDL